MSKKKPLVLYAVVCASGEVHWAMDLRESTAKSRVTRLDKVGGPRPPMRCGPHRIIKLQEVRSR